MSQPQPAILADLPAHARYLDLKLRSGTDTNQALVLAADQTFSERVTIGLGPGLLATTPGSVNGMRHFPSLSGPGCEVPSTQRDLWVWISGDDRGVIAGEARDLLAVLEPCFEPVEFTDGFKYRDGRDLSDYIDGTENPTGDEAAAAALVATGSNPPSGSSFVSVQRWTHDLRYFNALAQQDRDHIIGRRLSDNEELDEAPDSAHVKRTAQESFEPEAFVVRRSLPWSDTRGEGLMFVAFGHSLDAFEAQMRRMVGLDDGVVDDLFRFSQPVSGGYYWCPPASLGRLDLSALDA